MPRTPDVTQLLDHAKEGNRRAAAELLGLVYDELHALAIGRMQWERADHTLQPTALVHEAYLRLVDQVRVDWKGETHFKAVAAQAMHRVLVDHARARNREKRGGGCQPVRLHDAFALSGHQDLDALALHDALEKMERVDPRQAQVCRYRLYGDLSREEIARMLDVTTRTVDRDWRMGQAWLRREFSGDG